MSTDSADKGKGDGFCYVKYDRTLFCPRREIDQWCIVVTLLTQFYHPYQEYTIIKYHPFNLPTECIFWAISIPPQANAKMVLGKLSYTQALDIWNYLVIISLGTACTWESLNFSWIQLQVWFILLLFVFLNIYNRQSAEVPFLGNGLNLERETTATFNHEKGNGFGLKGGGLFLWERKEQSTYGYKYSWLPKHRVLFTPVENPLGRVTLKRDLTSERKLFRISLRIDTKTLLILERQKLHVWLSNLWQ